MASESARFSVPDSELPNLKLLAHARVKDLEALEGALQGAVPALDVEALSRSLADSTGLEATTIEPVVSLLSRFALVQLALELATGTFLDALAANLRDEKSDQWTEKDAECWARRKGRIARLLAADGAIACGAKATQLLLEQQLVFCKARILTDVRPVFDEQAQRVCGFLPFHTLALTCHEGTTMREMHIAMDFDALDRLGDHLDRAKRKERLIRENLAERGLRVIQTESDSDG